MLVLPRRLRLLGLAPQETLGQDTRQLHLPEPACWFARFPVNSGIGQIPDSYPSLSEILMRLD